MSFHVIMFILFVEAVLKPIEDARTQFRLCLSIFPMPVVAVVASSFCVSTTFNIMPKYHTYCECVCVCAESMCGVLLYCRLFSQYPYSFLLL
jgi:hypothetical protein